MLSVGVALALALTGSGASPLLDGLWRPEILIAHVADLRTSLASVGERHARKGNKPVLTRGQALHHRVSNLIGKHDPERFLPSGRNSFDGLGFKLVPYARYLIGPDDPDVNGGSRIVDRGGSNIFDIERHADRPLAHGFIVSDRLGRDLDMSLPLILDGLSIGRQLLLRDFDSTLRDVGLRFGRSGHASRDTQGFLSSAGLALGSGGHALRHGQSSLGFFRAVGGGFLGGDALLLSNLPLAPRDVQAADSGKRRYSGENNHDPFGKPDVAIRITALAVAFVAMVLAVLSFLNAVVVRHHGPRLIVRRLGFGALSLVLCTIAYVATGLWIAIG